MVWGPQVPRSAQTRPLVWKIPEVVKFPTLWYQELGICPKIAEFAKFAEFAENFSSNYYSNLDLFPVTNQVYDAFPILIRCF